MIVNRRFEIGGAERQLITLCKGLNKSEFEVVVATFYPGGGLESELRRVEKVEFLSLRKAGRWDALSPITRGARIAAKFRPDLIYGYMGPSNLVALGLGAMFRCATVWSIRGADPDRARTDRLYAATRGLEDRLSRFPDLVISNSVRGRQQALERGFPIEKIVVIPNGIDTDRFNYHAGARVRLREEWGVSSDATVIGVVGRIDPSKGLETFVAAAGILAAQRASFHFVCVGDGPAGYRAGLIAQARSMNLEGRLTWIPSTTDVPGVMSALDVLVSASKAEGFSNVIAEAMSCGRPCVVTDVGDSALIVGNTGEVARSRDPDALAAAIVELHRRMHDGDLRDDLARASQLRGRIVKDYSVARMIRATEATFTRLLERA
jgi:glycosyltransferase involved in cell wall biosynthesis